jgi:hypothetical protein
MQLFPMTRLIDACSYVNTNNAHVLYSIRPSLAVSVSSLFGNEICLGGGHMAS